MVLDVSSVVLVTEEEAEAVTGMSDATEAGAAILQRSNSATQWVVVKRGESGCVLVMQADDSPNGILVLKQPGFRVEVRDTVGCGDSFAAAVRFYVHSKVARLSRSICLVPYY